MFSAAIALCESSFLNGIENSLFRNTCKGKNELNYEVFANLKSEEVISIQDKKVSEQKNQRKVFAVDKLRKKFPNDFFKIP